jgi:hypothetical protein
VTPGASAHERRLETEALSVPEGTAEPNLDKTGVGVAYNSAEGWRQCGVQQCLVWSKKTRAFFYFSKERPSCESAYPSSLDSGRS